MGLRSLLDQVFVIAERVKGNVLFLEIMVRDFKAIGEDGHHALYFRAGLYQGVHRVQAAFSGADQVFDDHYVLMGL